MKINKTVVLILAVLMLCSLAACSEKDPALSGDNTDWVWVRDHPSYGVLSDIGYYYVYDAVLHYFDCAAKTSAVLCSKADCLHRNSNCDGYMPAQEHRRMYFANDRLYYIEQLESALYSRNAIGIELKKIGTIGVQYIEDQKAVSIGNCAVAGEYLYYEADVTARLTDEEGVTTTKLERACIGCINLSTGKDEILIEQNYDKQSQKLLLCAVRSNGVLLNRWEGMEEMDRQDPAFIEATNKIPVTLEQWSGETGDVAVLFRKTIKECAGIKMVSDGKVYYKSRSGQEANDGCTYSYDLNTGKTEMACSHRIRWHLGSSYVQCTDRETKKAFLYDMQTGKELPFEPEETGTIWNVEDNGFVMSISSENEMVHYFVSREALADGLEEVDLLPLYTVKMGYS